ncbi:hypothetical protein GGR50DRAFT_170129 [Xylaria sp. CBS 124048]|nr:hypothetical protein GGR50DRAFT_170129 [Xylaria sp. CBS 124048]
MKTPALPPTLVDGSDRPLFFSCTPNPPFNRPQGYTGSEVTTMLRTVQDGTDVTTLKLPRGTVNATCRVRSSTTGSWSSIESATLNRSLGTQTQTCVPGSQALCSIGVLELLECDDRPTFVVDTLNTPNALNALNSVTTGSFPILYSNTALHGSDITRQLVYGAAHNDQDDGKDYQNFKTWVMSGGTLSEELGARIPSYFYGGICWSAFTLRNRFRFVSANINDSSIVPISPKPPAELGTNLDPPGEILALVGQSQTMSKLDIDDDDTGEMGAQPIISDEEPMATQLAADSIPGTLVVLPQPSFDWTRIPLTSDLPEHIRFARNVDWASTSLGPIQDWPRELRTISNMVMASPHPAALYWGPEFTVIYNQAYIAVAGRKHPKLMGSRYGEAWSEIWDEIQPIFKSAWESGQAMLKNDDHLIVRRDSFDEEAFFSWSIVPLVGQNGAVVGLYNPAFENTRRKMAERMMLTLREVGERTSLARDIKSFWLQVNKGLDYSEDDVPFNLVYSVAEDPGTESVSVHSGSWMNPPRVNLEASLGVPPGHPCLVNHLDLKTSSEGFAPYMRESMSNSGRPITLSVEKGTLPRELMDMLNWRSSGGPCRSIVIFPVHPTTGSESVVGFIVMGVNPRRPYDQDYQLFVNLLSRQLATSLASVLLFEEEIRRGQRAAQMALADRQELTEQLHIRTLEAEESELRFTRMAEFAPVGMFIANGEGNITYSNDTWWDISRHNRSDSVNNWMQSVKDEDRPALEVVWKQLISEKVGITHEFRFKCARHEGGTVMDTWVLMSAYPEKDSGGGIQAIFGCITNISQQKLAERIQMQRREEAVELKRQQENFIDITSHEMRNPLSAILQCADEIAATLTSKFPMDEFRNSESLRLAISGCLEAANTISLCASHQKRIVDDVLTLSKLDSQLLLVTPVDVQPLAVVQRVIKMFEGELNTNDIEMKLQVKNRYIDMGINWVKLDPSRLLQVLINLMTNAIKFTQNLPKRSIVVTIGTSTDISQITEPGITYFPSDREDESDLRDHPDWGDGEKINLHFTVKDTGRGLDDHEMKLLFQRFSQASPRTHVQYGGSGLGLFISRTLTELQGGQIGVSSQRGVGSSFSFYIKSRKTADPPPENKPLICAPPLTRTPGSSTIIETQHPKHSIQDALNRTASLPAPEASIPVDNRRCFDVLIVEDNLVNQRVLQRSLRNVGNATKLANHGGEALDLLQKSRYWRGNESSGYDISVILMDLEMPVMDGMTCTRRIRELEREGTIVSHIPIIAVTAYARPEQIESAKGAGVDDVISKPFRVPDLMPRIEQLVKTQRNCTQNITT